MKERKPRQLWISHGTWCTVKVIAPLRRLANQAGECGRFAGTKCYLAAWMASEPYEFAPADHLQGPRREWKAYGTHQEWTRKAARPFYLASAFWMQADRLKRMVKPAIIPDKLAFLGWNTKEAQRLASNRDSHGMCCIVRALAERTQNVVASPVYKQDGTLTRGDEEREFRWQEHFAAVFG